MKAEGSLLIRRSIEDVFEFVSDFENLPRWSSALSKVTKVTEGPIGVGTVFREQGELLGRKIDSLREVTELQAPTSIAFTIREGTIPGWGKYTLEKVDEGTMVTISGEGELPRLMTLLSPLFSRMTRSPQALTNLPSAA